MPVNLQLWLRKSYEEKMRIPISGKLLIALIGVILLAPIGASAQTITLDNLPPGTVNDRFMTDVHNLNRPALSIIGFDNTEAGYNPNYGLGLRQILELRYNTNDPLITDVYEAVVNKSEETPVNPLTQSDKLGAHDNNTDIIQSRAFVALVTYILEKHGYDPTSPDFSLRTHADAMQRFKDAITNPPGGILTANAAVVDDIVKWARSACNLARAIDLYLAIENAYDYYGETNSSQLLSQSQKETLMADYKTGLDDIYSTLNTNVTVVATGIPQEWAPVLQKIPIFGEIFTLGSLIIGDENVEEVQPGNWSLKLKAAIGYGSMAMQYQGSYPTQLAEYRDTAMDALVFHGTGNQDRLLYWNYQVQGNKRFWAEGPFYLNYALMQVIPFWHASRANGKMTYFGQTANDPFVSDWFLNPIEWMADLITPDGKVPPLDDGNKRAAYTSSMLRWSGTYGDADVGRKWAWINEQHGGVSNEANIRLVALGIPRTADTSREPDAKVGNTAAPYNNDEQQLVVRRTAGGETYYVLLNGEHGDAVERGEGHEQPDQMQLLYYVNDHSYLVDSGYDQVAPATSNSTWNNYSDHNVMQVYPVILAVTPERPDGYKQPGIEPPYTDIVAGRKKSDHYDVDELYRTSVGNVDVLNARITLRTNTISSYVFDAADYRRRALFINDPVEPYLIDLNMVNSISQYSYKFIMSYHGNSNNMSRTPEQQGYALWQGIDGTSDNHLFLYPATIERDMYVNDAYMVHDDDIEEKPFVPIQRLDIYGFDADNIRYEHTTVAFIKALQGVPASQIDATVGSLPQAIDTTPLDWGVESRWHQGWTWQIDDNTIDFFAARSAQVFGRIPGLLDVSISDTLMAAGGVIVTLPANQEYGFVRMIKQNGAWVADTDYLVNFNMPEPPQPPSATITGPSILGSGDTGTWMANPSGGAGGYTYDWQYLLSCPGGGFGAERDKSVLPNGKGTPRPLAVNCGQWYSGGTASTFSLTVASGYNPTIELTVHDLVNASVTTTKYVTVTGSGGGLAADRLTATAHASAKAAAKALPTVYALDQNYPNPFRDATEIRFALPEAGPVSLVVYDVMGREVVRLAEETMTAGFHCVKWDASSLSSGVYLYRLKT